MRCGETRSASDVAKVRRSYTERFADAICMNSYSVLQSKELLHGIIRFDDSTYYHTKIVYLNSLISISTESTMSEELATTATAVTIITKRKVLNEK